MNIQTDYVSIVKNALDERYPKGAKACVVTFGCAQNENDSEKIRGVLYDLGYTECREMEQADLVVFNTCAIRESAELKIFGNIGKLKAVKSERPDMVIAVCGCMVMQQANIDKLKKSYPYVDIIFGVNAIDMIPELLYGHFESGSRKILEPDSSRQLREDTPIKRSSSVSASITIMYGCDNFCSYCIVPYVRGREHSREPEAILSEFRRLIQSGYKDITLLGQNVNSYGKNLKEPFDFADLLRLLCTVEGDYTIHYMSSHPKDFTRKVIDVIREEPRISRHIHLPVQSGNDRILREMNRRYTSDDYLDIIKYARYKIPDVTFSSDVIVGFPGETYEEYQDTEKLVREVGFIQLFTYIYSRRKGTRAAEMEDTVPHSEKARWLNQLIRIQQDITYSFLESRIGNTEKVLAEESKDGWIIGRTPGTLLVRYSGHESDIGSFVNVKITGKKGTTLIGERI